MKELENEVRAIKKDGLLWGTCELAYSLSLHAQNFCRCCCQALDCSTTKCCISALSNLVLRLQDCCTSHALHFVIITSNLIFFSGQLISEECKNVVLFITSKYCFTAVRLSFVCCVCKFAHSSACLQSRVRSLIMFLAAAAKLVPVGFGIRKMQITAVIEDAKVESMDSIIEEEIVRDGESEHIQSIDVVAFNKL